MKAKQNTQECFKRVKGNRKCSQSIRIPSRYVWITGAGGILSTFLFLEQIVGNSLIDGKKNSNSRCEGDKSICLLRFLVEDGRMFVI